MLKKGIRTIDLKKITVSIKSWLVRMQDQALRMGSISLTNNSRLIVLARRIACADCGSINWLMMSGREIERDD